PGTSSQRAVDQPASSLGGRRASRRPILRALWPEVPEPIRSASSSASVITVGPRLRIFSRGRGAALPLTRPTTVSPFSLTLNLGGALPGAPGSAIIQGCYLHGSGP